MPKQNGRAGRIVIITQGADPTLVYRGMGSCVSKLFVLQVAVQIHCVTRQLFWDVDGMCVYYTLTAFLVNTSVLYLHFYVWIGIFSLKFRWILQKCYIATYITVGVQIDAIFPICKQTKHVIKPCVDKPYVKKTIIRHHNYYDSGILINMIVISYWLQPCYCLVIIPVVQLCVFLHFFPTLLVQ